MRTLTLLAVLASPLPVLCVEHGWAPFLPQALSGALLRWTSPPAAAGYCAVEGTGAQDPAAPYQGCLEDVCGTKDEFFPYRLQWILAKNEVGPVDEALEKSLTDKIRKYHEVESLIFELERPDERTLDMAKEPEKHLDMSGLMEFVIIMIESSSILYDSDRLFAENDEVTKTLGRSLENLRDDIDVRNSPLDFLVSRYGDIPARDAVLRYIDDLTSIRSKALEEHGFLYGPDLDMLRVMAMTGAMRDVDLEMLIEGGLLLEIAKIALEHQERHPGQFADLMKTRALDWLGGLGPGELATRLTEELPSDADDEDGRKEKDRNERDLEKCLRIFREGMALYPTNEAIRGVLEVVEEEKSRFIDGVRSLGGLSGESMRKAVEKLESVSFSFPFSKEYLRTMFPIMLDGKVRLEESILRAMEEKFTTKVRFAIFLLSEMFPDVFGDDEDGAEVGLGEIGEFCEAAFEQDAFSDKAYTAFGRVVISHTVAQPAAPDHYRRGTVRHELGHVLMDALEEEGVSGETSRAFGKTKECLGGVQRAVSGDGASRYLEEDFADLASFVFGTEPQPRPLFCDYMIFGGEELLYGDLVSMDRSLHIDTVRKPDEDSEHPSLLFRTLRGFVEGGGRLPESCLGALEDEGVQSRSGLGLGGRCTMLPAAR